MRIYEMILKKNHKILVLIFFLVLLIRVYFAFQTTYFDNSGYQVKRYVDHIIETGKPILFDQLSYNGRETLYSPLWHYILAPFSMIMGDVALKLIPNIFISLLVFVIYLLSKKIIDNEELALFISLMSGFIPIIFINTLISVSVYSLAIPLTFYLIYLFMDMDKDKVDRFIFISFFLSLLHPVSILLSLGLFFYYLLSSSENLKIDRLKEEIMVFNLISTFFIQFLIYKKSFLEYGVGVIWNNVPSQIISNYFSFDILNILYSLGALTLILGFAGIIYGAARKKERLLLLSGFGLATLIMLWLRLISLKVGLIFFSISLVVASAFALNLFLNYLGKTKLPHYRLSFIFIVLSLILLSLVVPSFVLTSRYIDENVPSDYEILVFNWIKDNSLPDVTVLSPLGKGHYISAIAGKRTVIDDNFLLAPDTSQRYNDVERIYQTNSEFEALELIHKYNVDYIFIPIDVELQYGKIKWIDDEKCFKGIFFGTPKVYEVTC